MVGREAELARLDAAFDLAVESRFGRAVLIAGEAGVGKSRLVEELGTTVGPNLSNARRPVPLLRRRRHLLATR